MKTKKKNVTPYYSLITSTYSIGYVIMSAFSSYFLLDLGLSSGHIGILLAAGSLVAVCFQPFVGALIDHNPRVSSKKVMLLLSSLIVILAILLTSIKTDNIAVKSTIYGISIMDLFLAQPFMNALGVDALNYGYRINIGVSRAIGSLGYALGSYFFGIISVILGPSCIPVCFGIVYFILCLVLYIYPVEKEQIELPPEEKTNPLLFLNKYRRFAVILIGLILIYFSHSLLNTYALQIVTPKGGTSKDMGTAASIASICELITTLFYAFYMKHFKLKTLLRVTGFFFVLKTFLSLVVKTVTGFFLIQPLQMFGWGLIALGVVFYVNDMMDEHDKAQGQAFAGMAYTISSVLANLSGGKLIDSYGVNLMLIAGTISAALGTIIIWLSVKDIEHRTI